jgi:hypothetical protein
MSTEDKKSDLDQELETYDIAKLRKFASYNRVAISREMSKSDIIAAIKAKTKDRDVVLLAEAGSMPAPGFARIILHRDPTPGAGNRPVYVHVNGYKCTIPRGVEVDVPIKVVNVLNDAKEMRKEEDPSQPYNSPSRWRNVAVHSYPFQTLSMTPGPDPRPGLEKNKLAKYGPRVAFRDKFGRWPKRAELLEAIKDGIVKLNSGQDVDAKEFG